MVAPEAVLSSHSARSDSDATRPRLAAVDANDATRPQLPRAEPSASATSPALEQGAGFEIPGYTLLQRIGRGAMGSVFKARQESVGRTVAVKILDPKRPHPNVDERFLREARMLAKVKHPAIARVIEAGEADGVRFIVMEFIPGPSLECVVLAGRTLPEAQVRALLADLGTALGRLEAAGIVHRDIKPANILRRENGALTLCDFGLAKTAEEAGLTRSGVTLGTPLYLAPEAIRNARKVDLRADLYALGATAYHLACGRAPYPCLTVTELALLQREPPPDPRQLRPELSEELSALLLRLLAADPAARPRPGELARLAAPPTRPAAAPVRTRPALRAVGVLLAVGLVLGAGWYLRRARPSVASTGLAVEPLGAGDSLTVIPHPEPAPTRGLYAFRTGRVQRETRQVRTMVFRSRELAGEDWEARGASLRTRFTLLGPRRVIVGSDRREPLAVTLRTLGGARVKVTLQGGELTVWTAPAAGEALVLLRTTRLPGEPASDEPCVLDLSVVHRRTPRLVIALRRGDPRFERSEPEEADVLTATLPFGLPEVTVSIASDDAGRRGVGLTAEAYRTLPEDGE